MCNKTRQEEKKAHEQEILEKIYNKTNENMYKLIDNKSEKPDFILKDLSSNKVFGVEITKLYYNESSARLKEIPNYVSKLLHNGIPRRDQGILNPHQIYISINDEWVYLGNTIGQSFKKYEDYVDALVRVINDKTEKAKGYKQLDYLELFIDDKENYLYFKKVEDLEYLEKSEKLKEAVNKSPFKRIYLFTIIDKQEFLRIVGDLHSGPLFESEEKLKQHKEYMEEIYKNNKNNNQ